MLVALVVGERRSARRRSCSTSSPTRWRRSARSRVVIALGEPGERNQEIEDYAGLWNVRPWLAVAMAVFMLALLGFPIFGGMGFFAKWYVIKAALQAPQPQTVLAVILVLTSVDLRGLLPRRGAGDVHEAARRRTRSSVAHRCRLALSRDLSVRLHAPAVRRSSERLRDARSRQRPD